MVKLVADAQQHEERIFRNQEERQMSEPSNERPKVPEGKAKYVTTRQMEANEKGFVGYETVWDEWQKEVKYEKPKAP